MSLPAQAEKLAEALKAMLELQELDDQLGKWEKQRLALKKTVEESQKEVAACQAKQEELKKAFDVEKKKRGLMELEVKAQEAEAQKHNAQLSQLNSNDAYKAKLTEIQTTRKNIADLEEQVLRLIENEEGIKKQFEEETAKLAEQTKAAKEKESQMAAEAKEFEGKVAAEQGRRNKLLEAMGPNHAATYLRFHKGRKGRVITRVANDLCGACSMKVSAHQMNEAKKMKGLAYCQNCGVILAV